MCERLQDQIFAARIGETEVPQPRRAAAAQIVNDMQLHWVSVRVLRCTCIANLGCVNCAGDGFQIEGRLVEKRSRMLPHLAQQPLRVRLIFIRQYGKTLALVRPLAGF